MASARTAGGVLGEQSAVTAKSSSVKSDVSYFMSPFAPSAGMPCSALQHSRSPPEAGCGFIGSDLQEWQAECAAALPAGGFISPMAQGFEATSHAVISTATTSVRSGEDWQRKVFTTGL